MKPQISCLFLDIGGVLLTNGWGRERRQQAAIKFNLNYAELDERHHLTFDTYEEGKLTLEEYLDRVIFFEERPFSRDEFKSFIYAQSKPYPEMIDLVKRLKQRYRLKVATVSNEGRELTEYRIRTFNLGEFVDFFISSCYVHFRKPDEDIFRIALDVAQIPPEQVVYIDDRQLFVEISRGLGLTAIRHTDAASTKKQLEDLGLILDK